MLDVSCEAFGMGGGDYTVEEALGGGDCGCWGAEGTVEGEVVSSHCEAGAVHLLFFWLDVTVDFAVGASFVAGYLGFGYEHNCVCTLDGSDALGQLAQFIGEGAHPNVFVGAFDELAVFLGCPCHWVDDGIGLPHGVVGDWGSYCSAC